MDWHKLYVQWLFSMAVTPSLYKPLMARRLLGLPVFSRHLGLGGVQFL